MKPYISSRDALERKGVEKRLLCKDGKETIQIKRDDICDTVEINSTLKSVVKIILNIFKMKII